MFENLTDKLERSFKLLKGEGKITELNVAETLKEVRRALLDADVNYKVAKDFTNRVFDCISEFTELNKAQTDTEIQTDTDNTNHRRDTPDEIIYSRIHGLNCL